jgi:AraC-like DNA-binding protein
MYDREELASLAGAPKHLIETPGDPASGQAADADVLSGLLRSVRLSGSLQFCFMPTGDWQTDAEPAFESRAAGSSSGVMPFHIMVEGACWLKMPGRELDLAAGDVVAFPFATGHQLGVGRDGRLITPVKDLPPKPWREIPILHYGEGRSRVRLLCGYLQGDAMDFRPLRTALPPLLHMRTNATDAHWLRATIGQIVSEVDTPRTGGLSMLERLTEIVFIELLRHEILAARAGTVGWLAALADPSLARCLALIHDDPRQDWSVQALSTAAGLSRSTLAERFEAVLGTSPVRYVREWRLYLASVALRTSARTIATIGHDAGYADEAAFNRAFSRTYGAPPAAWRQQARAV